MTTLPRLDGPALPPASGHPPRSIVMLLHGYGSNGADLMAFAPIWQPRLRETLFLAPNAPERCPGAPGGFQWWGLSGFDRAAMSAGVAHAAPALDAFIDGQLAAHRLTEAQLVLVGFSQGAMMALHIGAMRVPAVAGVLGYSGLLADPLHDPAPRARPPVMLVHGDADPVVPIARMRQTDADLRALGFVVESQVSRGLEHGVDADGLQWGGAFVQRVLAAGDASA